MNKKNRDFDEVAATWDEKPQRVKLAQDIAGAMLKLIELKPDMDIMDFGCGTGLVSLSFQPLVRSVTGVDNSRGMLDVFDAKTAALKLDNVKSCMVDLDQQHPLPGGYHLVVSSMTLHHVEDLESLLSQLYNTLVPGGTLCIADLDLDDGRFHDDNTGIYHYGFDRAELSEIFLKSGFHNIQVADAAEITKEGSDGITRTFTIFIISGKK